MFISVTTKGILHNITFNDKTNEPDCISSPLIYFLVVCFDDINDNVMIEFKRKRKYVFAGSQHYTIIAAVKIIDKLLYLWPF